MVDEASLELWRNSTKGTRWISRFDKLGREESLVVAGGRSFTLTPFERQLNQDKVSNPGLDMFRNGTFQLLRAASETVKDEVSSPDSYSATEIRKLAVELSASVINLDDVLPLMTEDTLDRLEKELRSEGGPEWMFSEIQKRREALSTPEVLVVRKRVVSEGEAAPIVTTKVDEGEPAPAGTAFEDAVTTEKPKRTTKKKVEPEE